MKPVDIAAKGVSIKAGLDLGNYPGVTRRSFVMWETVELYRE